MGLVSYHYRVCGFSVLFPLCYDGTRCASLVLSSGVLCHPHWRIGQSSVFSYVYQPQSVYQCLMRDFGNLNITYKAHRTNESSWKFFGYTGSLFRLIMPDCTIFAQIHCWISAGHCCISCGRGAFGTNFIEICIKIHVHQLSFKKMHLKMLYTKFQPFCWGLSE